ncbi:MAG: AAA family ATPase [Saprospiraceae bacterium]
MGNQNSSLIKHIESILKDESYYSFRDSEDAYCTAIIENENVQILKLEAVHKDIKNNNVLFNLQQESRGTLVLLHLIPALILSYSEGINYFVDEINRSLHPILIRELLEQYLEHNIEKAKGQIIFNSHKDFMMDE